MEVMSLVVGCGCMRRVCSGCEGCGEVWVIRGRHGLHEGVWGIYGKP